MRVEVIATSANPAAMVVWVARFSHRSHDNSSREADADLLRRLISMGHWAALEFNRWTVRVDTDVGEMAELVRWLGEVKGWELSVADGGIIVSGNARTLLEGRHTKLGRRLFAAVAETPGWSWLRSGTAEPVPHRWEDAYIYAVDLDLPVEELAKHCAALFVFRDISRACATQILRHRPCSFMQESLRHVSPGDDGFWITPRTVEETQTTPRFEYLAWSAGHCYRDLVERGVPKEDARYVLPLGTKTTLVVMASLRQWAHMIRLRTSPHAQWEVRRLMQRVRQILTDKLPWYQDVVGETG